MPHLIKGGSLAGPPQAARRSERSLFIWKWATDTESPPWPSLRPGWARFSPPAGQIIRAAPMETWPRRFHNSVETSQRASSDSTTLPGYKLHVAGRVNPRPHINMLSGLLMIYTRLHSAAGGGRRGWEAASFGWASAAAPALCGLLGNWHCVKKNWSWINWCRNMFTTLVLGKVELTTSLN